MATKSEKQNRKIILRGLRKNNAETFLNSLPMGIQMFQGLFKYLDENLSGDDCDNNLTLTVEFLKQIQIENRGGVIQWLHDHGAYCDCEVLSNVEQQFEQI